MLPMFGFYFFNVSPGPVTLPRSRKSLRAQLPWRPWRCGRTTPWPSLSLCDIEGTCLCWRTLPEIWVEKMSDPEKPF